MNTIRTMPKTIERQSHKTVHRSSSSIRSTPSGPENLGFTPAQCERIRAIKAELKRS